MVSLFRKKFFLADLLEGFVDIHNHILPGIDDGAKEVQDSLDMLYAFSELGISQFVCTPHIYKERYPNTFDTILKAHLSLSEAVSERSDLQVQLDFAAEHMVDQNLEELLRSGQFLPMRKAYILIEMPFLQASLNMPHVIGLCKERNLFPILAHPERYRYMHHSMQTYYQYRKMGVFFQVNLLSLTGYYGTRIQAKALDLIQDDMVHFLGSDVHRAVEIERIKECQIAQKLQPAFEKAFDLHLEAFQA